MKIVIAAYWVGVLSITWSITRASDLTSALYFFGSACLVFAFGFGMKIAVSGGES